jgi:hypothetical protein
MLVQPFSNWVTLEKIISFTSGVMCDTAACGSPRTLPLARVEGIGLQTKSSLSIKGHTLKGL